MVKRLEVAFLLSAVMSLATGPTWAGEPGAGALDCLMEPSMVVKVSSQVPGILDQVNVERGDRVHRGEVLARLKSGLEKAAVELAQAQVDFDKRKLVRNEELYRKQLISIHEKDEMETEARVAELQYREAMEKLRLRIISSPIDAVVVDRKQSPGDYVGETPILTLADINPLHVEVIVPVERLGTIRKGMRAEVYPATPVGGKYEAKVAIVDQVIDAASGTFGVRLILPNPKHKLPAGLKCKVEFPAH